jgi:hypothetical protein
LGQRARSGGETVVWLELGDSVARQAGAVAAVDTVAAGGSGATSGTSRQSDSDAADSGQRTDLAHAFGTLTLIAASLAASGATWIALQPAVTHSALDGAVTGAFLRWMLYVVPTFLAVRVAAMWLDRAGPRHPGPVRVALSFAAAAVAAGTLAEIAGRATLGRGDVLAADGVVQRVIELVRVDVPVAALVAIVLVQYVLPEMRETSAVGAEDAEPGRSEEDAVAT